MSTRHTPDPPPEHNPAVEASSVPRHVDCKCGHDRKTHVEAASAPQCITPRCACLPYIPVTAPPRFRPKPTAPELVRDPNMSDTAEAVNGRPEPAPPVTPLREPLSRPPLAAAPPVPEPQISPPAAQGPTADELLKAGMRSQIPRTVKLAEKIALMVHDLCGRVADERRAAEECCKAEEEKAQARADVERLTREPAAATARLQGKTSGAPAAAAPNEGLDRRGRHINRTPANCPDCGKRSGTSASAISSLTSWASRTGPRDGPTSGGSYAGSLLNRVCSLWTSRRPRRLPKRRGSRCPTGHGACCSALGGDRDA